jgi:hypothetical protein
MTLDWTFWAEQARLGFVQRNEGATSLELHAS